MRKVYRVILQVMTYAGFVAFLGYLSASPAYQYAGDDMATIKLSLSHASNRVKPCVILTPEEIAELAPNMRNAERCERERLPLFVRLEMDGKLIAQIEAPPSGLWDDGPASVYQRIEVEPGEHYITASLRDSNREDGWDYTHTEQITLQPGRYFTITFRANSGGFTFN
jgi:hypothetical protein